MTVADAIENFRTLTKAFDQAAAKFDFGLLNQGDMTRLKANLETAFVHLKRGSSAAIAADNTILTELSTSINKMHVRRRSLMPVETKQQSDWDHLLPLLRAVRDVTDQFKIIAANLEFDEFNTQAQRIHDLLPRLLAIVERGKLTSEQRRYAERVMCAYNQQVDRISTLIDIAEAEEVFSAAASACSAASEEQKAPTVPATGKFAARLVKSVVWLGLFILILRFIDKTPFGVPGTLSFIILVVAVLKMLDKIFDN
jgi:hypothetical protein